MVHQPYAHTSKIVGTRCHQSLTAHNLEGYSAQALNESTFQAEGEI